MNDNEELRRLAQAVSGWSNCNQAWLDCSEDVPAAVVGHIYEDGNTYPVAVIDCDQYYAAHESLPLAKFYAAANPAAMIELLDRLEEAKKAWKISDQSAYDLTEKVIPNVREKLEAAEKELVEIRHGAAVANDTIKALCAKLERVEKQRDVLIGTMRVLAARPAVDEGRNNWEAIVWESICFAEEAIARTTGD